MFFLCAEGILDGLLVCLSFTGSRVCGFFGYTCVSVSCNLSDWH